MPSFMSWADEIVANRVAHVVKTVGDTALEDYSGLTLAAVTDAEPRDEARWGAAKQMHRYLGKFIQAAVVPMYRPGSLSAALNSPAQLAALEAEEQVVRTALREAYPQVFFSDERADVALERVKQAAKTVKLDRVSAALPFHS